MTTLLRWSLPREARPAYFSTRQEQDLTALSGQGAGTDREREPSREREIVEQRRETLTALEAVWNEMARDYPAARSYVAMRRGEPITWDNLCALTERLGPKTALVEFYTLPDEIAVFVLRAGWEMPRVHRAPVGQRQLRYRVVSFFREVAEHISYPELNQTWQRLASPLLSDVLPHLKDAKLVYFIPHGLLHYLPLHALEVDGAPLVEHFPVAYAPSAAVLGRVIEQAEERATNGSGSTLVVGNPTGDLPFAESEAQIIAQYFGVRPYLCQEATKDLVVEKVKGQHNAHLACHGYFQPLEPLQSGIVLHDGVLTAQEILALRLQAELLVLSACQTAQQEVGRGDELMGLTRTLLYAGASSLVVSLWSVNDRSTGELMQRFYDMLYKEGPSPRPSRAKVLRQAMLDIRRQPGWEHPYYWAPFILVGIV
jgi:CHAT domain-containing protein